eukprot:264058-Karenia_brevis.AAC.1
MRGGKHCALGTWIRAVQEGQTVPRAAEALQMLTEMSERCSKEQITALEASLDRAPMIPGDGQKVRSLVQTYYCERCNAMPMTGGQWFLFKRENGNQ